MPVLTVPETCEHPQLAENEMLTSYEDPEIGTVKTVATPFELSRTPGGPHSHPPALGEHNDEVLSRRLNLTSDEIERLREERVIT